jgi:hypothetical protein
MGQYDAATKRSLGRAKIRQDQDAADLLAAKLWTPKVQTKIKEAKKVEVPKTWFPIQEPIKPLVQKSPPRIEIEFEEGPPFDPGSFNPRPLTYEALKLLDRVYRAAKARKT